MRAFPLLAVLLALVWITAPVAAAGTPGPFAGVVRQGQTNSHQFNNNPANQPCLQVMMDYGVSLVYSPPTDTLTLSAKGRTATGHSGVASISFSASACTSFTITVTGTSVANAAAYVVEVSSGKGVIGCGNMC